MEQLTYEGRQELRARIDEVRRARLGTEVKPLRRSAKFDRIPGQGCPSILGPFAENPGSRCDRPPKPGEAYCGLHLFQRRQQERQQEQRAAHPSPT